MSNAGDVQKRIAGTLGVDEGGESTVKELLGVPVIYNKTAADGAAATTTADTKFWANPFSFSLRLERVQYTADAGITANDTNYATFNVKKDDAAGGALAVMSTADTTTTGTGTFATDTPIEFDVTAANAVLAAGAGVHFGIAKAGSGVVVTSGVLTLYFSRV